MALPRGTGIGSGRWEVALPEYDQLNGPPAFLASRLSIPQPYFNESGNCSKSGYSGPASSNRTERSVSSYNLEATMQPVVPPPTTIWSYFMIKFLRRHCFKWLTLYQVLESNNEVIITAGSTVSDCEIYVMEADRPGHICVTSTTAGNSFPIWRNSLVVPSENTAR